MKLSRRGFITNSCAAVAVLSFAERLMGVEVARRPNILWLTAEDANVDWFSVYGGANAARTPNIDRLAKEGFTYTHCFANYAVCAPSRSTWITGIHAVSMGTHNHRSRYDIPHGRIKYYPDHLRAAGYHCTNRPKTDYNIGGRPDNDCWNSRKQYGWRDRSEGQPFFTVINCNESHESRAFGQVGETDHCPDEVQLRSYHPDLPDIRWNYAHYQDAVSRMDANIGRSLAELEKDGLAEDTIVFFCTDHGGVMPRSKRYLFDSGIHSPFIARIPEKFRHLWPAERPGDSVDRIVSFIDMPKTWLSLARANVPSTMQGRIFLGPDDEGPRKYHFSCRGRMDERPSSERCVRDRNHIYIKNYMPYLARGEHLAYMWRIVATRAWDEHHRAGLTDATTGRFFEPADSYEELYDTRSDHDNVVNVAGNPENQPQLREMRRAMRDWQLEIHDSGLLPESEVVRLANEADLTIYDFVRDRELYRLPAYLDAADAALSDAGADEGDLVDMLDDDDLGIRYWGAVGLTRLDGLRSETLSRLGRLLRDESHEVRLMAAWSIYRSGDKNAARRCINDLLTTHSYAAFTAMNLIQWMGDDPSHYRDAVEALEPGNYHTKRFKEYMLRL